MASGTVFLASLLLVTSTVPADVAYINRRNFTIPIQIDPARRAEIKSLNLFKSNNQGVTYEQIAFATPDQSEFTFFAPSDGEYWFNVQVVDQQGNRYPPDILKTPPAQKVRIDTTPPTLKIVSAEWQGDELLVSWDIRDDHLDLQSLKLEYRPVHEPEHGMWYSDPLIQPVPTGKSRIRAKAEAVVVRMKVADQAGNETVAQKEVAGPAHLHAAHVPSSLPTTTGTVAEVASPAVNFQTPEWPEPRVHADNRPNLSFPPAPTAGGAGLRHSYAEAPAYPSAMPEAYTASGAYYSQPSHPVAAPSGPATPGNDSHLRPIAWSHPPKEHVSARVIPDGRSGYPATGDALPPIQMTNRKMLSLEYEVLEMGQSGLGKVEVFVTQDNGQTWRFLADDPDLKSPVHVELPGEGIYGLRLVLTSGLQISSGPPKAGDVPEMRVQVDTTPPMVQLYEPKPVSQRRDTLLLRWSATDQHMANLPIVLEWAEHATGPWNMISGAPLPNTGHYNWQLPGNLPPRVYLRLTARDLAGNVSEAITREPIMTDLREPVGKIKAIQISNRMD
ncbi:MAG: hypothetical protein ACK4RK_05140 [Gemmataceae bacterium]